MWWTAYLCRNPFTSPLTLPTTPLRVAWFIYYCVQHGELNTMANTLHYLAPAFPKLAAELFLYFRATQNSSYVSQRTANGTSSNITTMKRFYPLRREFDLAVANGVRAPSRVMLQNPKTEDTAYRSLTYSHCSALRYKQRQPLVSSLSHTQKNESVGKNENDNSKHFKIRVVWITLRFCSSCNFRIFHVVVMSKNKK